MQPANKQSCQFLSRVTGRSTTTTFHRLVLFSLFLALLSAERLAVAQDYLYAVGNPAFSTNFPVELGAINISNGNLHLEIGLSDIPQRGNLSGESKLVYDSRIWEIQSSGLFTYQWVPDNVWRSMGGWRFVTAIGGLPDYNQVHLTCDGQPSLHTSGVHTSSSNTSSDSISSSGISGNSPDPGEFGNTHYGKFSGSIRRGEGMSSISLPASRMCAPLVPKMCPAGMPPPPTRRATAHT